MGKTFCQSCKKKCSGEVLRVQDKYFHTSCFKCKVCSNSLAQGGFFSKDGAYYCTSDYQKNFGTKCASCGDYVEGEVVTALGKTYHQKCFTCARCRQPFPSGEKVTYTGKEVLCQKCVQIPVRDSTPKSTPTTVSPLPNECAGCREDLKEGQVLVALDKSWHIWCFKCHCCGTVLHGEYMGKDGVPYCERDYQKQFGVKCAYCNRYISGKVLQAGDNHHFHPTCARCSKCGDPFGDGEEMYLQGGAVWHPRCGPGPQTEDGRILNGPQENGNVTDTDVSTKDFDRHSTSGASELQFSMRSRTPSLNGSLYSPTSMHRKQHYGHSTYRTPSPGLILRDYSKSGTIADDISRIYTYSYLTDEPTLGYLKKPIEPYDRPPHYSPHFHRPTSQNSLRSSTGAGGKRYGSRSAMKVLVDSIRSETPRPKSPHMNNEEPIELSHYPGAKPPQPGEPPKIERDDFPAPPYPYTDPERRKRWSDSYKGVPDSDEEELDGLTEKEIEDIKLKKEEEELSKLGSGIGKVFLKNVKEREKFKQWKAANLDPRNASRTPSANKEPAYRLRYDNPIGASPSRNLDHSRPFDDEEFDRSMSCRSSSMSRPSGWNYNVVSSLRNVPRPGYGLKASTLPSGNGFVGDYSFAGMGVKTHSTDFSSGKSDISTGSITDVETRMHSELGPVPVSYAVGRYGLPGSYGGSSHVRRSLPNMAHQMLINEPAKIYPYHLLLITNYRLPPDADRLNLERHLSDQEFEAIFQVPRAEFYRLPQWRRNEVKRRARLF